MRFFGLLQQYLMATRALMRHDAQNKSTNQSTDRRRAPRAAPERWGVANRSVLLTWLPPCLSMALSAQPWPAAPASRRTSSCCIEISPRLPTCAPLPCSNATTLRCPSRSASRIVTDESNRRRTQSLSYSTPIMHNIAPGMGDHARPRIQHPMPHPLAVEETARGPEHQCR